MTNNDNDRRIYKFLRDISIPRQLKANEFRFIKLRRYTDDAEDCKKPIEKDWLKTNNYRHDDTSLRGWMLGGGNYGILTGHGGMVALDADDHQRLEEVGFVGMLPKTLVFQSGSGGRHYIFFCDGIKKRIKLFDKDEPDRHLGEFQTHGQYIVGPGSIHPNGEQYTILIDLPIAELSFEKLQELLAVVNTHENTTSCKQRPVYNKTPEVDITRIARPVGEKQRVGPNGTELFGEHPIHGSDGGSNFHINVDKGVWYCHRCSSGGGWVEWLAVRENIISCRQAGGGCLTKNQYKRVMKIAEDMGLIEKWAPTPLTHSPETVCTQLSRTILTEIPTELPNKKITILKAPPRTGKTYATILWLNEKGSGNFITHRHAIIEHAIKIAEEHHLVGAVWVEGKHRPGMCRLQHTNCESCLLKPDEKQKGAMGHFELIRKATGLLYRVKILTKDNVPIDLCPYWTLKYAEKSARYCFTVVQNINDIRQRELTIIDEDPTLQYFYPPSVELAQMKKIRGEVHVINYLEGIKSELDAIMNEGKRPTIKKSAKILSELYDCIEKSGGNIKEAEEVSTEILKRWEKTNKYVREKPTHYGKDQDKLTLDKCINALADIYLPKPVVSMSSRAGYKSIYLLGDASKPTMNMDWFNEAGQLVVIGSTMGEIFAAELEGDKVVWEIPEFKYTDRFVVISVNKEDTKDPERKHQREKKSVLDIAKEVARSPDQNIRRPFMVLTGSKYVQQHVAEKLPENYQSVSDREVGEEWVYAAGQPNIFYQNSVISRGLDVDQYNLLFAYDTNFVQPFWGTHDRTIADALVADETTNAVLRISPTQRRDSGAAKVVVIPSTDIWKVKFLTDRIIEPKIEVTNIDSYERGVARYLKSVGICGLCRKIDDGIRIESPGFVQLDSVELLDLREMSEGLEKGADILEDREMESLSGAVKRVFNNSNSGYSFKELIKATKMNTNILRQVVRFMYSHGQLRYRKHNKVVIWHKKDK